MTSGIEGLCGILILQNQTGAERVLGEINHDFNPLAGRDGDR